MDTDLAPVNLDNEDSEHSEHSEHSEDNEDSVESDESENRAWSDEDEDEDEEDEEICKDEGMPNEMKKIKKYLLMLKRPVGISDKAYDSCRQFALKFLVHEGLLFFRNKVNI